MKAAQIMGYGGSEVFELRNIAKPIPKENEILIQIFSAGVNPYDVKVRAGRVHKNNPVSFPKTMGIDFSGLVDSVGPHVAEVKKGDIVYGQIDFFGGTGAFAEFGLTRSEWIATKPKNISHEEAAALPLSGVSALQALTEHMNITPHSRILIHGGAGGIGSYAIQLAKYTGAFVATAVATKDIEYVQSLGADTIIDYTKKSFEKEIMSMDFVFDTVGQDTFTRSFLVLKRGGMIVSMVEKDDGTLAKTFGVRVVSQITDVTESRLDALRAFVERGALKVVIDKIFSLDETAEALTHLEKKSPRGKVVIQIK